MKLASTRFIIDPEQPVRQAGFSQQVNPVSLVHDHLYARLIGLDDGQRKVFLLSVDSIGQPPLLTQDLDSWAKEKYGTDCDVIVSATHTHFAGDPRNETYAAQLMRQFKAGFEALQWQEYDQIAVSHQHVYCDKVGSSRISSHPTKNIFLDLITLWHHDDRLATLIVHNCHPTIQNGDTPWFSGEYPGYVCQQLTEAYNGEFFTFMQGADGDISTRFTRPFQNYDAVMILGDRLKDEIITLRNQDTAKEPLALGFGKTVLPFEHSFEPIDTSNLPANLAPRELETIKVGQQERQKLAGHPEKLVQSATLSYLDLGIVRLLFAPNELFSSFIDCIDITKCVLVCYSNGYAPYVTDPALTGITYEKFTDTLTVATKEKYKKILTDWGH